MSDARLATWLSLDFWCGILMLFIRLKAISLILVTKMSTKVAAISSNWIDSASIAKIV